MSQSEPDPVYVEAAFGQASSWGSKKDRIRLETKDQSIPEVPSSQTYRSTSRLLLPGVAKDINNYYSHNPGHSPQVRKCYNAQSQVAQGYP